jgi:hypothetical protein
LRLDLVKLVNSTVEAAIVGQTAAPSRGSTLPDAEYRLYRRIAS